MRSLGSAVPVSGSPGSSPAEPPGTFYTVSWDILALGFALRVRF